MMGSTTKQCTMCRSERIVMLERRFNADDAAWLEKTEVICSACARQFEQNPDSQYIVVGGAYYRKVSNVYAKVGPVGAFHG
jgi:hypothetical protein